VRLFTNLFQRDFIELAPSRVVGRTITLTMGLDICAKSATKNSKRFHA
jgi:hypothetical protein